MNKRNLSIVGIFLCLAISIFLYYKHISEKKEGFVKYFSPDINEFLNFTDQPGDYYPANVPGGIRKQSFQNQQLNDAFLRIIKLDSAGRPEFDPALMQKTTQGSSELKEILDKVIVARLLKETGQNIQIQNIESSEKLMSPDSIALYRGTIFIINQSISNDTDYSSRVKYTIVRGRDGKSFYITLLMVVDEPIEDYTDGPKPSNEFSENFQILNKLHLMGPFKTSQDIMGMTEAEVTAALDKKNSKATENAFLCFGSTNPSAKTREECQASNGYWDSPVSQDTPQDCKYYKANKNYPNELGGPNMGGYCKGPLGTQLIGFREFSKNKIYQPICANCKVGFDGLPGQGQCCEEQAANLQQYNMESPDYVYPGDEAIRKSIDMQTGAFSARGLSWSRFGKNYEASNIPIKTSERETSYNTQLATTVDPNAKNNIYLENNSPSRYIN